MSAKLLYSLSDENQNLKKQIGCMNGLLQFFDPHHFINNRVISSPSHRRIPPDENKQQGRALNNASKRSKEKNMDVIKEMQVNPIESSRLSISSSGSTTISSSNYDSATKPEQSPFAETMCRERQSWDYRANEPHSSPHQPTSPAKMSHYFHKTHNRETAPNSASQIKPAPKEVVIYDPNHMDSPRLAHTSRPDSPRLAALNESFRSITSNHSAPAVTPSPRNKDPARFSYDGRETRDYISTMKLKDLPRLSLDSKQRTIKESINVPQEPASCRTPSNIVAKLMGLEALPDHNPNSNKSQMKHNGSGILPNSDSFSRSSRTIDESKVDRVLNSPRSKFKESKAPRLSKDKSGQTASIHQEAHSEPINHPLTVYGEIERRLGDIDFQKSGKDLRALKQILESMQREKNKLEIQKDNPSSHCASPASNSSSTHVSQKQGPKKATLPTSKGLGSVKDVRSAKEIKQSKLVTDSRKEATQVVQDIPLTRLQRIRIVQRPEDGTKDSVHKKTAKDLKETHHIMNKYSRERTPRSIRTSKAPQTMTKANVTSSARISDTKRTNMHCVTPATTTSSRVKQREQAISQNQKLSRNFSLLQETDDQSSEFSNDSACLSQQQHTNSFLSQQQVSDNKNPEGTRGDTITALEELSITVREQPSPVSVLDAGFYDDESPSPVKKKPTAFRDFESNTIYTKAEWNNTDPTYSSHSMRPGFGYVSDCQKVEVLKESAPTVWILSSYQCGSLKNARPNHKDLNLEKSYVSEILSASGFLHNFNCVDDHLVQQSQEVIDHKLFYELEQTKGSSFISDKRYYNEIDRITRTNERHKRRLLFDAVNETLSQKHSQSRPLLKKQSRLITSGPQLLQEIYKEIEKLQPINLPHGLDDEDDFLTTIIEKDLTHRSANWTDFSGEIPALVLDIERLIFKDLIVELVHDEAAEVQVQKHSKQ